MHDISLYERKIINDEEFPVEIFENHIRQIGMYYPLHWHEHIELHYILNGHGIIYCNQKPIYVEEGNLVILNGNELHKGFSNTKEFDALVIIFEMSSFSKEIANYNVIFQSLVESDDKVKELLLAINREESEKALGYKLAIKGKLYELITYLFRNYVEESLSTSESVRRTKNLSRLNTVLKYIQDYYSEPITNGELADMIHLSEYRFCHIFKDSIGVSPLNYINEIRLKKAYNLLEKEEMTISEIAAAVGFQDYNNFGRLFRKYYGYAPSNVWVEKDKQRKDQS